MRTKKSAPYTARLEARPLPRRRRALARAAALEATAADEISAAGFIARNRVCTRGRMRLTVPAETWPTAPVPAAPELVPIARGTGRADVARRRLRAA